MAQTREGRRMWAFGRNKALTTGWPGQSMQAPEEPAPPPPEE